MGHRLVALALVTAVAAGCGVRMAAPPPGPAAVRVNVTRDFGATTVATGRAAPGQSAMNALRRTARVSTSYAGRFVTSVNGLAANPGEALGWLYFINGIQADRGATDYTLHPGDNEWWDYHQWSELIGGVPVAIGAWPEPFLHGYGGRAPSVSVTGPCSAQIATALRAAGAQVVAQMSPFRVVVTTFNRAATTLAPADWQGRGLTVFLDHGRVIVYHGRGGLRPQPDAAGLIVGYQPGDTTGGSAEVLVAGADRAAACAAAHTLASDPSVVRSTYAVATDANGHVVAIGGRG